MSKHVRFLALFSLLLTAASCSRNVGTGDNRQPSGAKPVQAKPTLLADHGAAANETPHHNQTGHVEPKSEPQPHHHNHSATPPHAPRPHAASPVATSPHAKKPHHENPPHLPASGGKEVATVPQPFPVGKDESALTLFEKRILPIFQSANASSCSECHLSGVDLKDYIRPTQQETFVSLVGAGMIDLKKPDESKLLRFISRSPESPSLVSDKVRKEEYAAFRAWIQAAAADPQLLAAKDGATPIGPQLPAEVIRHARQDRALASFVDNVWSEVGRCAACHSPDRNQKQVKEHGEQVSWIKLRDPQATLNHLIEYELIDSSEPEKSLILLKPTMQVKHGGGQKMVIGDRTYKQFRRFIDDYAATVQGKYTTSEQLPKPASEVSVTTDVWLKIEGVPAKYDKKLLQADLYRSTDTGWSEYRVATSDRPVFGKNNLWQHSLSLTAPRGSQWSGEIKSERLPSGRYLLKLYIDQQDKLQKDFKAELGEAEFVGQVEVQSRWSPGYGQMTVVKFPSP